LIGDAFLERRRSMATVIIQKRNRKKGIRYLVNYKDPFSGKKKYYRTLSRLRDAQQVANDLRTLLDAGKAAEVKSSKRKISLLTFEEVCRSLKAIWKGRHDRSELSETSYRGYCDRLSLLERDFGNKLLCEISHNEIVEYRNRVASETSNLTSNRSLFILKRVFKQGMEMNAIKNDSVASMPYLSEKRHIRNEFLTPPQLDHLLEACQGWRSKGLLPAVICLGAEHGASKQEILDLTWSDIFFDFEGSGRIRFYRTKNRRERTEYLMPRTKQTLLEWRQHQDWIRRRKRIEDKGPGFVFSKLDGRRLVCFNRSWRKACEIAGFPSLHFHDLRHTFCSNLILSGADLKDAKEMIGHSDLKMTDRYAHLTSMRKLSRQVDLARFYSNSEGMKESSVPHRSHTEVKNGSLNKKRAD
jgi:integrase